MKPGDYLIKCDFYKTGVKVNKDRVVPIEVVIEAVLVSDRLKEIY